MPRAEHADHIQPIVDLVSPAKASIDRCLLQKPSSTPVVQADLEPCPAAESQRGVLGNTKRRGEVMQQQQHIPAACSQAPREVDGSSEVCDCRCWRVEGVLVELEQL